MALTSISIPPPELRPPKQVALAASQSQRCSASAVSLAPAASRTLAVVRAAEWVNAFGSEWWFAGLLIAIFAAVLGRQLCG